MNIWKWTKREIKASLSHYRKTGDIEHIKDVFRIIQFAFNYNKNKRKDKESKERKDR